MTYMLASLMDSVTGRTMTIVFGPDDYASMMKHWNSPDVLLTELQDLSSFRGRKRWCDLSPLHFKFLITKSVEQVFTMLSSENLHDASVDELADQGVVNTMNFLLLAYVKAIQEVADQRIENIRITRHAKNEITLNLVSFVDSNYRALAPSQEKTDGPSFKLISKDEE